MTTEPGVRGLRVVAASMAVYGAGPLAACGPDQAAGVWRDELRGLGCLSVRRHVRVAEGGGIALDTALQEWTLPGGGRFSDGLVDGGAEVERDATGGERVTLRQWILRPGVELAVGSACAPVGESACPLDPGNRGTVTGRVHRDDPRTRLAEGFAGFPEFAGKGAPGAGWDTLAGAVPTCAGAGTRAAHGGATPLGSAPLLLSGPLRRLVPGVPWEVSLVVGASHDGDDAMALHAAMVPEGDGGEAADGLDLREAELAGPAVPEWGRMTAASFSFRPAEDATWRLRVTAPAGADAHCLMIGPAYLTAQLGRWTSPVLDSLSERTDWRSVEWELDQSSAVRDPACVCHTPGAPVTPVRVWWEAAAADPVSPRFGAAAPLPDRGTAPVAAGMSGRYFRFGVTMHGRGTAADASAELASRDPRMRFAGWRPRVRRLRVRYGAAEARADSALIVPARLASWGALSWKGDAPGGTSLAVDVLDLDGTVIAADVSRGFDLGAAVDPFAHPAIRLRARIASDPADPAARAVLRRWEVRWTRQAGRVALDRAAIRPGERVRGLAPVERAGRVRIRVHDAAGRTVARLLDEWSPVRTAAFAWDGTDTAGRAVAPGEYHVAVTTAGGAGTRRVRVAP